MRTSEAIATEFFYRIRKRCDLGMREYLAAIEAIQGGYESRLELKQILQMLWCHSPEEQLLFDTQWDAYQNTLKDRIQTETKPLKESSVYIPPKEENIQIPTENPKTEPEVLSPQTESNAQLDYATVYAPASTTTYEEELDLGLYFPLSRRAMIYLWRFLRRPVADGVADVLDVQATIDHASRQGFYQEPIFRRRISNRAHLLLLIDRGGSMVPCHRFTEDLLETAREYGKIGKVDVFYFYNVPTNHLYFDDRQTEPVALEDVLQNCDRDTSILIVSDGGAARGYCSLQRVEQTRTFLLALRQYSRFIGWLNPIPKERWVGSSAEFIAYLAPMQEMSSDGMGYLIDVLRGTSLLHVQGGG
jgi:uncharacterized protein